MAPTPSVHQLYRRLETIGKGAYGSVFKGIHIKTGTVVALKIVDLDQPDDDIEDIRKEVALLSSLKGDERSNITSYYGCWLDGACVWIAMDFAQGGSIRTLVGGPFLILGLVLSPNTPDEGVQGRHCR